MCIYTNTSLGLSKSKTNQQNYTAKQVLLMKGDISKCVLSNICMEQEEEVNVSVWEVFRDGSERELSPSLQWGEILNFTFVFLYSQC